MIGYANEVEPETLSPTLKELHAGYIARSGTLPGPFKVWMNHETVAPGMKAYAEFAIRGSSLSEREREIVVLLCAVACGSDYVCTAHRRSAARVGLSEAQIEAICSGGEPEFSTAREQGIFRVAKEMSAHRHGTRAAFEAGVAALGLPTICEIAALYGFYAATSVTLNFCGARLSDK
jgi:4-carboxymuconolactone decarboxylase